VLPRIIYQKYPVGVDLAYTVSYLDTTATGIVNTHLATHGDNIHSRWHNKLRPTPRTLT